MQQLIDQLETQVDFHLMEAITRFQNLDNDTLLKPSVSGGWSIAQCLEHLNRYGHYYLPEIRSRLELNKSKSNDDVTFRSTWLGSYFTKMMDPRTGTKKIKAFKEYKPAPDLDAHAVVSEFISQQETLLQLLRASRSSDLEKIRIPISIAKFIRLKLGDVFQFIIAHNERHVRQAMRNLPARAAIFENRSL